MSYSIIHLSPVSAAIWPGVDTPTHGHVTHNVSLLGLQMSIYVICIYINHAFLSFIFIVHI